MIFEAGTTDYDQDILRIKLALSHLETNCSAPNSHMLGPPVSRFGWTFFQIAFKPILIDRIESKFSDMIQRYKGKPEDQIVGFLADFFESKNCKIRLKFVE